jgi:hypothetical protein
MRVVGQHRGVGGRGGRDPLGLRRRGAIDDARRCDRAADELGRARRAVDRVEASSPPTVWRPVRVTSPAKKVWMSPVTKVTSSIASAAMWSTSSWRSVP